MDIDNNKLLNILYYKSVTSGNALSVEQCEEELLSVNSSDTISVNGEEINFFGNTDDETILNYFENCNDATVNESKEVVSLVQANNDPTVQTLYSGTRVEDPAVAAKNALIKSAVYNYRHPSVSSSVTTSYGTNFNSICNTLGISSTSSITKADLSRLAQNDSVEDSNSDLMGALNRAFADKSPNDKIEYKELMLFFMRGAGYDNNMTTSEYERVVNKYSDKLQNQYKSLSSPSQKLNFILEKTENYLTEAGLDLQLQALNRLKNQSGTTNTHGYEQVCNVGQIAFANLGGWENLTDDNGNTVYLSGYSDQNGNPVPVKTITNGAYSFKSYQYPRVYSDYLASLWVGDSDDNYNDLGLTLNSNYFSQKPVLYDYGSYVKYEYEDYKWYELVEVMVHELTHATAYYFYDVSGAYSRPSERGLDYLVNKGIITSAQKAQIIADVNSNQYSTESLEDYYLIDTIWGEYSAYIQSANYLDSIGGDIFDSYNNLAVDGIYEKSEIENHIAELYDTNCGTGNKEPKPSDSKWQYYA